MTLLPWTIKNLYHFTMLENSDFHSTDTQRKTQEPHPTNFNIITLILALYKGHLPCSRTPRSVTVASRSIWSLMLLTVEWTSACCAGYSSPNSLPSPPIPTELPLSRCFLHTLTHINSLHTTWFSKAATHQKMSIPAKCLLLNNGAGKNFS